MAFGISQPASPQGVTIGNAVIPKEGPKAVPYALDFTVNPSYSIDLLFLFQQKLLSVIQCVWVDNSQCTSDITFQIAATGQFLKVPAGWQGYLPLLSPTQGQMVISGGGGVANIDLINVPMPGVLWGDPSPLAFDVTGALKTADQNLAPLIQTAAGQTSPGLNVNILAGGSANGLQYKPFNFSTTSLSTINQTVVNYNNTIHINQWEIALSEDAIMAAAASGEIELYDTTTGNLVWQARISVGTASENNGRRIISRQQDIGYKGQTNGVFRFGGNFGANLTAGALEIFGTFADI